MKEIHLAKKRSLITPIASDICHEIADINKAKNPEYKMNREIKILFRQLGKNNIKNRLSLSIFLFEEDHPDFSGKSIEPLREFSPLIKEKPVSCKFPNGITLEIDREKYQVIVTGFGKSEENNFLAIILAGYAFHIFFENVLKMLVKKSRIDQSPFLSQWHPLHPILDREHLAQMDKRRKRYEKK